MFFLNQLSATTVFFPSTPGDEASYMATSSKWAIDTAHLFQWLSILLFHLTRSHATHLRIERRSSMRRKFQECVEGIYQFMTPYDFRYMAKRWLWVIRDLNPKEPMKFGTATEDAVCKSMFFPIEN
ncbi:hypothetical protein TNCV_2627041 [Trichonephila clavipes]|uniref:Uncharacterized protein n=1 Tax=Trichonephila clavipes TaxID=2585209 RepID=A0A8X6W7X1_TRICX|nr:hypothetical protein TNCV_2627041 [Trichonephila clavipes]